MVRFLQVVKGKGDSHSVSCGLTIGYQTPLRGTGLEETTPLSLLILHSPGLEGRKDTEASNQISLTLIFWGYGGNAGRSRQSTFIAVNTCHTCSKPSSL